jgi:hypothetical protein
MSGRLSLLLLFIYPFMNCYAQKDELIGHWHSVPQYGPFYKTLDITDSTTHVNKYALDAREPATNRFIANGEELIVFNWQSYSDFEVRNDTLILNEAIKFVRITESHHLSDRYLHTEAQLKLPKAIGLPEVQLPAPGLISNLFIGPPKRPLKTGETLNADSTIFQTWDLLVGPEGLDRFVIVEREKLSDSYDPVLIIHADSSTSQKTIEQVLNTIAPLSLMKGYYLARYNYEKDMFEYEVLEPEQKP